MKLTRIFLITGLLALSITAMNGCGGGGGGGGGTGGGSPTTGAIRGYVDKGAVARVAGRSAPVTPVAATITVKSGTQVVNYTSTNGYFDISGITPGNFVEVTATAGYIVLKGYFTIVAGQIVTKNIDSRTTAAGMIYEHVKDTTNAPTDISNVEDSGQIADVETEIETALAAQNYSYTSIYNGATVATVVNNINNGASLNDTTAPTLTITYYQTEPGKVVDVDFHSSTTFYIQIAYSDAGAMDFSSLNVTFKMDDGTAQDISQYFQQTNSTTVRSSGIDAFIDTLFALPTNDVARTMTVSVSLKDKSGNKGTATTSFIVFPAAPPSQ